MAKADKLIKNIIRSIIVFYIFWNSVYLKLIPIKLFHLDPNNISDTTKALISLFSNTTLLIIFYLIYRKDLKEDFKKFMKKPLENIDTGIKYWFIGLFIMIITNIAINYFFNAGGANNEIAIQSMIKKMPLAMLILAGVIGPFNEEIAFRKTLKDVFFNKWVFAFFSFLLFGGAHVIESATTIIDYLYIIPYGALGGAFALAYYDTDTVFTSVFLHMAHNIILTTISIIAL